MSEPTSQLITRPAPDCPHCRERWEAGAKYGTLFCSECSPESFPDGKTRYWLSWWEPAGDHRPLAFPPNAAILGWWCSGSDDNERSAICALVEARNADEAWKAVEKDWPCPKQCARDVRFIDEVEKDGDAVLKLSPTTCTTSRRPPSGKSGATN